MTPSSDGNVITTIASAHCHGGPETTAIAPGGDPRCTGAGAAGDAREARRLEGFGEAHRGQDGDQPARQPRLPHPR
jgi:hypothetical protein